MIPFQHRHTRVTKAIPLDNFKAYLVFDDGLEGEADLSEFIIGRKGMFEPINDPQYFQKMSVENMTITWPNEADIAPDTLYWKVQNKNQYQFQDLDQSFTKF